LIERNRPHLWFQVDDGDHDLATFFYFLGLAAPKRRGPLPLLTSEYRQGLPSFTRNFFREFYGRFKSPVTLVFDNYQEVSADSDLNQIMPVALAELPNAAAAIFISRSEPPPSFANLRAKQAIELLDWSEIKFTPSEVNNLLRRRALWRWPRKLVDQLHATADGWAAGLVLLLEQYKRDGGTSMTIEAASSQVLFDYFASEIFKLMDEETKDVLLQTAFLSRIAPNIAAELTGSARAGEILALLHRRNYFTNRFAGTQTRYEYHPLFREFLLAEARRFYNPDQQTKICRLAADLLERSGDIETAVALYSEAQDWHDLISLIRKHASALVHQGRSQTLLEWLGRIPESMLEREPWLLYWRAVCQQGYHFAESRRDAIRAIEGFRAQKDAVGAYTAWSTAVFTILYEAQDAQQFDFWITLMEELRREFPVFPSEPVETHVACGMLATITWRQLRHPDAKYWIERGFELARRSPDQVLRSQILTILVINFVARGDFVQIDDVAAELEKITRERTAPPLALLGAYVGLAWLWPTGQSEASLRAAERVIEVAEIGGFTKVLVGYRTFRLIAASGLAGSLLSQGDSDAARHWLSEPLEESGHAGQAYVLWYRACVVWEALLRQDFQRAAAAAEPLMAISQDTGWALDEASAKLVALQALHETGCTSEVSAMLLRVIELADEMDSPFLEFMARMAEAQIAFDQGKDRDGLVALRRALTLGRKGGYCTSYGWRPTVMAKLCAKALEAGIEVDYVRNLIVKRQLVMEERIEIEAWPWPVKIYTLGRFAIEKNDQPLTFGHKVQRKPLALLKAIIAYGGHDVREEEFLDLLWPDADGDAARIALNSAIHRLRKLLGHEETILRKENRIGLNERICWVDAFAVERLLREAERYNASDERFWSHAIQTVRRAAALYRGPFSDSEVAAADALSDRLRRRLLTQLLRISAEAERLEQWQDAISFYEQGFNADPASEAVCRRLMNLYHQLGRRADALSIYNQCRQALKQRMGTTPSTETEALLKRVTSS
jgi:ATP/maltotriose-dependent transcriptional regulator MalT/DNA-binding SARP family transcriptional activator